MKIKYVYSGNHRGNQGYGGVALHEVNKQPKNRKFFAKSSSSFPSSDRLVGG